MLSNILCGNIPLKPKNLNLRVKSKIVKPLSMYLDINVNFAGTVNEY